MRLPRRCAFLRFGKVSWRYEPRASGALLRLPFFSVLERLEICPGTGVLASARLMICSGRGCSGTSSWPSLWSWRGGDQRDCIILDRAIVPLLVGAAVELVAMLKEYWEVL